MPPYTRRTLGHAKYTELLRDRLPTLIGEFVPNTMGLTIEGRERKAIIIALLISGMPCYDIAAELECNLATVYRTANEPKALNHPKHTAYPHGYPLNKPLGPPTLRRIKKLAEVGISIDHIGQQVRQSSDRVRKALSILYKT